MTAESGEGGLLTWVRSASIVDGDKWHLSFDRSMTLCERSVDDRRPFREGAPAYRCAECAEVITWRLGLVTAR